MSGSKFLKGATALILLAVLIVTACLPTGKVCREQSLWDLAKQNKDVLKISTLFTAQNVRDYLSTDEGMNNAIDWCKKTGDKYTWPLKFPRTGHAKPVS